MEEFYTYGSEAYAPISIELPSHLPEEPKEKEPLLIEEKKGVSFLAVIGGGVVLLLFLGLLISMIQLFEARSERAELRRQLQQLQTRHERLTTRYESTVDMDTVAQRAEAMGMHAPWVEQVQYIDVEQSEVVSQTTRTIQEGIRDTFYTVTEDMEAYFS